MNLNKPIKDISTAVEGKTIITFTDDTQITLNGTPFELNTKTNLNRCVYCGHPAGQYPLYSKDNHTFLCRECVIKAYQTFLEHNVPMPLNINITKEKSNG